MSPPPVIERPIKRIMLGMMLSLRRATLVGNQAPNVKDIWKRMEDVRPGDLVYEDSLAYWLLYEDPDFKDSRWDGQFITYLRTEFQSIDDGDGGSFTEKVQVCQNPDGTEFNWTNASLLAVPDGLLDTLPPVTLQ